MSAQIREALELALRAMRESQHCVIEPGPMNLVCDAIALAETALNVEAASDEIDAAAKPTTKRVEHPSTALVLYAIEDAKQLPLEMYFSRAVARQELKAYDESCKVHPYDAVRRPERKGGGA
jgi:hypothetical protein